jgi:predicted outer membrane protein
VSQQPSEGTEKTRKILRSKSGAGFNQACIDNEVSYHTTVLKTVEYILIPQACNKELKVLLHNVVPTIKTHLEHSEMEDNARTKK